MWYNNFGDYMIRQSSLMALLNENDIDAMLVTEESNVYYYSGFLSTNASLLITAEKAYLITDFRYKEMAEKLDNGFEVLITGENSSLSDVVNKLRKKHKYNSIGLEGDYVTRNQWLDYERHINVRIKDINIDQLREVKDQSEVEIIKAAIKIAEEAFIKTLDFLEVGKSEKEVARYLENEMMKLGAESISFTTIVASGERSSLPHGVASDKLINNNELITFDFGCKYKNYCSDITRTVAIGEISPELVKVYETVKAANQLGLETVRAGMSGMEVDAIVRKFIYDAGYEGKFEHGLGHSIGIDIHENPRLRNDMDHQLQVGNIVTIEPGIYLEGIGGVRIEDDVLLLEDGIEVLTSLDKELIYVGGKI